MAAVNAVVYIGAASPLFQYTPTRNGPVGESWTLSKDGCGILGGASFAVDLGEMYYADLVFAWSGNGKFAVQVGIDGALQAGPASLGGVTLSSPYGPHKARLETTCQSCAGSEAFTLHGARLSTIMSGNNSTLDDSSTLITYQGFTKADAAESGVPAIRSGSFYLNTVSYTSTAGSTASFSFQGTALYVFGPTGPEFGVYSVKLDGGDMGSYNASTTIDTYHTLLFFASALDDAQHSLVFTNQVDGQLFALDYIVAVQSGPGDDAGLTTTVVGGGATATQVAGPGATAVFPGGSDSGAAPGGHNGAAGAAIGGTLGALAAILLLWILWRWWAWKKAGGEGSFFEACCGKWNKDAPPPPPKPGKFPLWPMVSFKPKYAT